MLKLFLFTVMFCSAIALSAAEGRGTPPERIFPKIRDYFTFGIYEFGNNPAHQAFLSRTQNIAPAQLYDIYAKAYAESNLNTVLTAHDHYMTPCAKYGMNLIMHKYFFYNARNNPELAKKQWCSYVERYRNNPNLLSWYLYDEIESPKISEELGKIRKAIFQIDQTRPCSVVTSSVHTNVAAMFQYYMWDCYMFYTATADGGSLGRLKTFARQAAASAPYINVAVIQANDYGNYDPSPAEVRAQTFAVLANGSNGVLYYLGLVPLCSWSKWTQKDNYFNIANLREKALLDFYGTPNGKLRAIAEMGEKLLPRGYLLASGKSLPDFPGLSVRCGKYTQTLPREDKNKILRGVTEDIPAVEAGVWQREDALVIIPYNNDVCRTRKAEISFRAPSERHCLYNLWTLEKVNWKNGGSFRVELAPGDGCFYFCSTPEAFEKEKAVILHKDTEQRLKKLQFHLREPGSRKYLDLTQADALAEQSRQLLSEGKSAAANALAKQAEAAFASARQNSAEYTSIETSIAKCRQILFRLNGFLAEKSLVFYDTAWWQPLMPGHDLARLDSPIGLGLPRLDAILQKLRLASARFYPLLSAFTNGKEQEGLEASFSELAGDLENIFAELRNYKFEKGPDKIRLGFLALELPGGRKNFTKDTWEFANLCVRNAAMIFLSDDGRFVNAEGEEVDLNEFDLLWWDYSTPEGGAFLDRGKQVRVPKALLSPQVIRRIREYLSTGKGLLLTKLAAFYVVPLGVEKVEPNFVLVNRKTFLTDVLMGSQVTYKIQLGIKPTPGNDNHPLFRGFSPTGTFFKGEDLTKTRSLASWVYPAVPENGNVIGQREAYFSPLPDQKYFDLVEFPCGKGRIIACVSPGIEFDLNFSDRGKRYWHYLDMQKFVFNLLEYLGTPEKRLPFVKQKITRPFLHEDIAKAERNPALTWKASSGNAAPLFHSVRGGANVWISGENNAFIECDFGKTALIGKVVVNSFFYNSRWNTTHLRLKIKDEKSGAFVDLNPPAVYENADLIWEAARFSFAPVRTSAIRIEEIRRAPDRKVLKGHTQASPPNGIANITVYGKTE